MLGRRVPWIIAAWSLLSPPAVLAQEGWSELRERMADLGRACAPDAPQRDANFDAAAQLFLQGLTSDDMDFYAADIAEGLGLRAETMACYIAAWREDAELAEVHRIAGFVDDLQDDFQMSAGAGDLQTFTEDVIMAEPMIVPVLTPTRAFLPPHRFPPEGYRGYGLIAFTSRATEADHDRHHAICTAFHASMEPTGGVSAGIEDQFLTAWPVETDEAAEELNAFDGTASEACETAIAAYDLETADRVMAVARLSGARLSGRGPFLLAWAPTKTFGFEDAFVLALDLSRVDDYDEAQILMNEWKTDITEDFEILANGFSVERMRVKIRRWADAYGEGFLSLLPGG
ncbi:MAG: hypothetical protein ACOCYW_06845 [Roseicyclus sp.]